MARKVLALMADSGTGMDEQYYQVAAQRSWGERLVVMARDRIYADILRHCRPAPDQTILDVGVSDVVTDAANMLERKYPHPERITAAGLGEGAAFKAAYPNETALDPAAQMRRNIASARLAGGQVGADEFTALSAALGEAMGGLRGKGAIATLEYRERGLLVKLKPDTVDAAAMAQVRAALAARNLVLSEPAPGTWQIRSAGAAGISNAGAKS